MENTKVVDCTAESILVSTLLRAGGHEMNDGNEIPLELAISDVRLMMHARTPVGNPVGDGILLLNDSIYFIF